MNYQTNSSFSAQIGRNVCFQKAEKKAEFLNPEIKTKLSSNKSKLYKQFRCLLKQRKIFIWNTSAVGVKITITDAFNLRSVNYACCLFNQTAKFNSAGHSSRLFCKKILFPIVLIIYIMILLVVGVDDLCYR